MQCKTEVNLDISLDACVLKYRAEKAAGRLVKTPEPSKLRHQAPGTAPATSTPWSRAATKHREEQRRRSKARREELLPRWELEEDGTPQQHQQPQQQQQPLQQQQPQQQGLVGSAIAIARGSPPSATAPPAAGPLPPAGTLPATASGTATPRSHSQKRSHPSRRTPLVVAPRRTKEHLPRAMAFKGRVSKPARLRSAVSYTPTTPVRHPPPWTHPEELRTKRARPRAPEPRPAERTAPSGCHRASAPRQPRGPDGAVTYPPPVPSPPERRARPAHRSPPARSSPGPSLSREELEELVHVQQRQLQALAAAFSSANRVQRHQPISLTQPRPRQEW